MKLYYDNVLLRVSNTGFLLSLFTKIIGSITLVFLLMFSMKASAATLLQDDFAGTIIDTTKWLEIDAAGTGGTTGNVQQNNVLTVGNSNTGTWGQTALASVKSFSATGLELSADMTRASDQLLGYGNYNFQSAGTSAYIIDLLGVSGVSTLVFSNGSLVNDAGTSGGIGSCGTATAGAIYKMKIITGGFEVYKNGVLLCTRTTTLTLTSKPVFLQGSSTASSFDNVLVTGATVPDAPTIGSATGANGQVSVSFTAPASNGGDPITSYTVTSSPGGITATGTSSPIYIGGLANNTAYTFTVTATNISGNSVPSAASNSVTLTDAAILLSDDFTGTTINTSKWVEVDPAGAGGASGSIQQNNVLSITNSYVGSVWGQTALYSVDTFASTSLSMSAVFNRGASDQLLGYGDYNFQSAGTKAYMVDVLSGGSVVALVFNNGSNVGNTSCGTHTAGAIYRLTVVSGGFQVYKNNTLACSVSTGVSITNKPIFLQSSNSSASTFDNLLVTGVAPVVAAPDAPVIGSASAGNAQATVSFSIPASNGAAITGYTVTSSPGGVIATGTSSPITVTGLTNNTSYTFTVTATNSAGTSVPSSSSNAVTPAIPQAPAQVTGLNAYGTNQQVLLSWVKPSDGGSTITDYKVEYKLVSDSNWNIYNDGTSATSKSIVKGLNNESSYNFRVSAINSIGTGSVSATATAAPRSITTLAFVITGESNSGGLGLNSDATPQELASHSSVQITNLTSGNFLYENLQIGVNNLRDHNGLDAYYDNSHGFELQLANAVEAHMFPDNERIYLTKTGQGGSVVAQWNVGNTYWTKHLQRTAAAKTQLPTDRQWVVWLSLGINDAIYGTATSTWKAAMVAHINKIKADLPGAIIILTEFQSMSANSGYPAYNTIIEEIAAEEANVFAITTTGAALKDSNHWSYTGLKTVTSSLVAMTKTQLGLIYPGVPTAIIPSIENNDLLLSWSAPVANGGASIGDYRVEYKPSSTNSYTLVNDGVSATTTARITGLTPGASFDVRISAVNSNGVGNPSLLSSIRIPQSNGGGSTRPSSVVSIPIQTPLVIPKDTEPTKCEPKGITGTKSVKIGSISKTDVKGVQIAINQMNILTIPLKEDGLFGPKTYNAIRVAQKKLNVVADGAWGKNTQAVYLKWVESECK